MGSTSTCPKPACTPPLNGSGRHTRTLQRDVGVIGSGAGRAAGRAGATETGVVPDAPRPSVAEIRRALAECMTVEDIDDAMGWAPGTARRRRWRIPERGGLPFADAELAGVPLWFRTTIETW